MSPGTEGFQNVCAQHNKTKQMKKTTQQSVRNPVSWSPLLIFSNKRNQGSLKKWLPLRLGQEKLEPGTSGSARKKCSKTKPLPWLGYVKGTQEPNERVEWPKLEQFEQQNKVVLDYNLKYKLTMYEFILILNNTIEKINAEEETGLSCRRIPYNFVQTPLPRQGVHNSPLLRVGCT